MARLKIVMTSLPLPLRGVLYDLVQTRKEFDSFTSLRELVEFLAACRLNTLVLYLDDLWQLRKHPGLVHPHAYPFAELVDLAQEARSQGIDFIPSVTTLGHSGAKLRRSGYRHLAFPGDGDFDVFNPAMYDLFADIFDEILPHFPSPYFFINGDETGYVHLSDQARDEAAKHGLGALYGRAMGRLCRIVLERGRRPILWHDMLLHHPEATDAIPREAIIAYWYYDRQTHVAFEYFSALGFDVIGASGLTGTVRGLPNLARHLPAIHEMTRAAATDGDKCLGSLLTIWCDIRWQSSLLPIYALGRWSHQPYLSLAEVCRDFAGDVFGLSLPDLGNRLVAASAEVARLELFESFPTLQGHAEPRRERLRQLLDGVAPQTPPRNAELFRSVGDSVQRLLAPPTRAVVAPPAQPRPLLSLSLVSPGEARCRAVRGKTSFGHELLVLTNGRLAVALLPEFAATLIEWVVLDDPPWSALVTGYEAWAAREPRVPGDPGLGSPWSASGIHGWRETIFFNSRLNPCTLWGRPFQVETHQTDTEITCICRGRNEVGDVTRTIRLQHGQSALSIESVATARHGPCYLSIRPNVVHALPGTPTPRVELQEENRPPRSILEHDGTMHFTPAGSWLRFQSLANHHAFEMAFEPDEVEQVLTDLAPDRFTVEPFGVARRCEPGQAVRLRLIYRLT